jgi:hypothetical protein
VAVEPGARNAERGTVASDAERPVDPFWFDEYDTGRPFRSFVPTVGQVLLRPRRFFARLDPEGGFLTPLAFASGYVAIYAALSTIASALVEVRLHGATLALPNVLGATLANIGASILAVWLASPLVVAVYHLFVRVVVGRANRGYRATFRVLTYTGATDLIGWLPYVGPFVAGAWALYVGSLGLRELHQTSLRRALAALLIPTLLAGTLAALGVIFGPTLVELTRR